jgi:hypothetical protein
LGNFLIIPRELPSGDDSNVRTNKKARGADRSGGRYFLPALMNRVDSYFTCG